jgi:hypothetical protein
MMLWATASDLAGGYVEKVGGLEIIKLLHT